MDPNFLKRAGVQWGNGVGGSLIDSRNKYEPIPDADRREDGDAEKDDAHERRPLFLAQSSSVIEDSASKPKRAAYFVGIGVVLTTIFATSTFVLVSRSASTATPFTVPGDAAWLCHNVQSSMTTKPERDVCAPGDGTPDYEAYMPIVYSILGDDNTIIARAIVNNSTPCPVIVMRQNDGDEVGSHEQNPDTPEVIERAVGNDRLPFAFPVRVCEAKLLRDISSTAHSFFFGDKKIPIVSNDPSKFVVLGDTGLRSKPANLGLGLCPEGPLMYGVHQCLQNITKEDIDPYQFQGHFQDLSDWPLKTLMNRAVEENPDVLVHMGDFIYRQGPCPFPNNNNASCSGINLPRRYNFSGSDQLDEIMNFVPGTFGDTFWSWWADFFYPSLEALSSLPWIALRGNHESCSRAGRGWFLLLSPDPYPPDAVGGSHCADYTEPRQISFQHEEFLIIDDSSIEPKDHGFDGLQFIEGDCPTETGSDLPLPEIMNRFLATNPPQECEHIYSQLDIFTRHFEYVEEMSGKSDKTSFYLGHRPILGIACNDTKLLSMDWTLQCSLSCSTFDRISALFSGHMHWRETITFEDNRLPPQIVVGHGGTDLVENYIIERSLDGLKLEVGTEISVTIREGNPDSSSFGYAVLQREGDNIETYSVKFRGIDMSSGGVYHVGRPMTIPRGPFIDGRGSACQQKQQNTHVCSPPMGHKCSR